MRDGRGLKCEDPRQMLCVLAQSVLGFFETAVIGLLWREFRCIAAAVPAEEERLWDEKALPMSAIEVSLATMVLDPVLIDVVAGVYA